MAKNHAADVGPINSQTGKPFYSPQQWAHVQAQLAAEARAAHEAALNLREKTSQHPTAGTLPKVPTGAEMGQSNPGGPAGSRATLGRMMPGQKPIREVLSAAAQQLQQATLIANNNRAYTLATPAQRRERDLTWIVPPSSATVGKSPTQVRTESHEADTHKPPAAFVPNPVSRVSVLNGGKKTSGSPGGTGGTGGTGGGGPTSPPGTSGGSTYSPAQHSSSGSSGSALTRPPELRSSILRGSDGDSVGLPAVSESPGILPRRHDRLNRPPRTACNTPLPPSL